MAGASVADQMEIGLDNGNIRKHGIQLLALADMSTPWPAAFFEEVTANGFVTTLPIALPTGFRNMGLITTDGIGHSQDISTSDVNAVQSTEVQRSDVDSETNTFSVTFLEQSAWTQGLAHKLPVSAWPAKNGPEFDYADAPGGAYPRYRGLIFAQDGVGDDRVFRVEGLPEIQVTGAGDRTQNRSDTENTERTFTRYPNRAAGYSIRRISKKYKRAVSA